MLDNIIKNRNSKRRYSAQLMKALMLSRTIKVLSYRQLLLLLLASFSFQSTAEIEAKWQRVDINKKVSLRGCAVSGNALWVSGSNNSVFVSQDNGISWADRSVKASPKTDFRDIALFDKNTAIVMGAGEGSQSVLYKTTDAGKSWQVLKQNKDAKGFYDSIAFWDEQRGLLLGDPVDGFYLVEKTQDGGKTWRRIAKTKLPIMYDKEAAFAASGNTIITGENGKAWLTTGGFSASVYYSEDFGENWQRQAVPVFDDTQTAGGYGLALNHEQQLFVLGGDYQQRSTRYNNIATFIKETWQRVAAKQRGLRTAMSCLNETCIATGKTGSDISIDGGKTWQAFDDKNAAEGSRGFYTLASGKDVILAAGVDGKVAVYLPPRKHR